MGSIWRLNHRALKPQESANEPSDTWGDAGHGLLAGVAKDAVRTDDWWGQLGERSIEAQLLSDLREDGALPEWRSQHAKMPMQHCCTAGGRKHPANWVRHTLRVQWR